MEIYTFNFTKKSTQWYLNEFRNMKFIATDSHSFPTNRNFIRIDDSFTENDIVNAKRIKRIPICIFIQLKSENEKKLCASLTMYKGAPSL